MCPLRLVLVVLADWVLELVQVELVVLVVPLRPPP